MSSPCNSSSSSSERTLWISGFVPYDEDLEPLATAEEAAEHEARMAEEEEIEREVDVSTWYDK